MINTVKPGVDAPGSSIGHRGQCIDGPQRKQAMETSVGCGDSDFCNDSRADGAGVTQETYAWTCPPVGGVCRGASAEPGPEDYADRETGNPRGRPVEVTMSSDAQAWPCHMPGQEPSKAGSNPSPPRCVELTPGSQNELAQKTGCPVARAAGL